RVESDDPYALYSLGVRHPLATAYSTWRRVPSSARALRDVLTPGFQPSRLLVVEGGLPSRPSPRSPARADLEVVDSAPQRVTITVSGKRSMVFVRIPFDTEWHATVDGHSVPILHGDYVDMAVMVRAGRHTVEFGYD